MKWFVDLSVRAKLLIAFLVIGLIPLAAGGSFAYRLIEGEVTHLNSESLEELSEEVIDKIDRNMFERYGHAQAFALSDAARSMESDSITGWMSTMMSTFTPVYRLMRVVDRNGRVVAAVGLGSDGRPFVPLQLIGANSAQETWYQPIMAGQVPIGETLVQDVRRSDTLTQLFEGQQQADIALDFVAPIYNERRVVIGAWVNTINWPAVQSILQDEERRSRSQGRSTLELALVNRDGVLLYGPDQSQILRNDISSRYPSFLRSIASSGMFEGPRLGSQDSALLTYARSRGFGSYPSQGWSVVAAQSTREVLIEAERLRNGLLGAGIAAALLILFAALGFSGFITRPVADLAAVAASVQSGNLRARARVRGRDELGGVATSLNTMLDEITVLVQTRDERDALQKQISKLLDEVSDVAQGDLTVQAEVTNGSLGAVADAFNYMIEELRGIIENVNRTATEVADSTNRILDASGTLAVQAEAQAQRILQATSAVDEMSAVAQTVASNAAAGAEIAGVAQRNAADGSQAVRDTVDGMQRIRAQVQETSKKIKRLGESSQEIGQIVQLIQEIADQTNLLALNAAIQAAMAGEHGRGFAVVADEVRRLAERASGATKQIAGLVTSIQADTNEAVLAMEDGTREVVDGSRLAQTAGEHLQSINLVVDQLSVLIEEISAAAAREAVASDSIREAMVEISETTNSSAAGSREAAESVGYLARLSDQLKTSVGAFRIADQKQSAPGAA